MHAYVSRAIDGPAASQSSAGSRSSGNASSFSVSYEFRHAPPITRYFSRAFSRPVAVFGVNPDHRRRHRHRLMRLQDHAGVRGELPVPCNAAEQNAQIEPAGSERPSSTRTAGKPMSLVSANAENASAIIESHVELVRQPEQVARVQDVQRKPIRMRTKVQQRLRAIPLSGEAVMLRMLSSREPRELMPRAAFGTRWRGYNSRICTFARVARSPRPQPQSSAMLAIPRICAEVSTAPGTRMRRMNESCARAT